MNIDEIKREIHKTIGVEESLDLWAYGNATVLDLLTLCDSHDQQAKELAELRAANLAISETHHRLSFDAREAEARRADAESERDRLKAEVEAGREWFNLGKLAVAIANGQALPSSATALDDNPVNCVSSLRAEVARLQKERELAIKCQNATSESFYTLQAEMRAIDKQLFMPPLSYQPDRSLAISTMKEMHRAEVARLQKELKRAIAVANLESSNADNAYRERMQLTRERDAAQIPPDLRAALLHVLSQYDGDEYREVLSGLAARLREQG